MSLMRETLTALAILLAGLAVALLPVDRSLRMLLAALVIVIGSGAAAFVRSRQSA
jgi:hypothetical protein